MLEQGTFQALGPDSTLSKVITELGGRNVATAPELMTTRRIMTLDPEVWIGTSPSSSSLADLRKLRELRNVSAIRHGRVEHVDPAQLEPSPALPGQLQALARLLHPTA
jgi:ABC-type Fe3+-hydroxamate transport system substrate-binding protein